VQHVVVSDAQDANAVRFDPLLARSIVRGSVEMAIAVKLECEPSLVTIGIQEIASDRMLAAEFQAGEAPVAETAPKQPLGNG
jgi:hypothetical protein